MKGTDVGDDERAIVRVLSRVVMNLARDEIKSAEAVVRASRVESGLDDPESIRKLRLAYRRAKYQLEAMAAVDTTLATKSLIRRLHDVGRPFGRLRDAEILEGRLSKVLAGNESTAGKQLLSIAKEARRMEQESADVLLDSRSYDDAWHAVEEYRSALPPVSVSTAMARPVVQDVVSTSWRRVRGAAKKAERASTDAQLHTLRKCLKRTLYTTRAFSYVLGPASEEFVGRVDALQKLLGRQHDHVIVEEWLVQVGRECPSLRDLTSKLAADERKRADVCAKHWTRYWRSVGDLRPRETLLALAPSPSPSRVEEFLEA